MMVTLFALLAASTLLALAIFQLCLIAGKPWGRMAWGGKYDVLPSGLRIASGVSIALYAAFAWAILAKAGLLSSGLSDGFVDMAMWVLTGYFFTGIVMNGISRSKIERNVMTPVVTLLFVSFMVVALS